MNQDTAPIEGAGQEATEHLTSLVVWDGPSPAVIGSAASIKVGIGCTCGCDLSMGRVLLRNATGELIASASAEKVLEQSGALYWVELAFVAPAEKGVAHFSAAADLSGVEPPHADAASDFTLRVEPRPEHRVTVRATFDETGEPIANAELFLSGYIKRTDAKGQAQFDLPTGQYECSFRKFGFRVDPVTIAVMGDLTFDLSVSRGETREDLERRLSAMEDHPWG